MTIVRQRVFFSVRKLSMQSVINLPRLVLDEDDLRYIFEEKCKDFGLKFTEKLFQRFVNNQSKKTFKKIFEMESCSLGPLAACAVADTVYKYNNIKVVCISGNNIGDKGAAAFSTLLQSTSRIISVDISSNSIGDLGCSLIFKALKENKSVIQLKIGSSSGVARNTLGVKSIQQMAEMFSENKVLSEIDLSMTEITADTIQAISKGLKENKTIQVINLQNNNMQTKGASYLLRALVNSQIRELNFSNNHIGDVASKEFANFFQTNKSLNTLNISGNSFTAKFTGAIAEALGANTSIRELNLSKNNIGGQGIAALGPVFTTNETLHHLNVSFCKIDAAGFETFAINLKQNKTLQCLNLGHNPLRDAGATKLADIIKVHPSLRDIDLELCEINDSGSDNLFKALTQSKIVDTVSIKNNLIKNGIPIQTCVNENTHILNLNIEFNDIDFKLFTEIQRQVKSNMKAWQDGHKTRIEGELESLQECEANLHLTRNSIADERKEIAQLEETLSAAEASLVEAQESKKTNIANLEQQFKDICDKCTEQLDRLREEHGNAQHDVDMMTQTRDSLAMNLESEISNFKQYNKTFAKTNQTIDEMGTSTVDELRNLDLEIKDKRQRYKDAISILTDAYESVKAQQAAQAAIQEAQANAGNEEQKPVQPPASAKSTKAGAKKGAAGKGKKGGKGGKGKKGKKEEPVANENENKEQNNTEAADANPPAEGESKPAEETKTE